MSETAPHAPSDGPSDWPDVVRGNHFANLDRLGRWVGGTTVVPVRVDPSRYFKPVASGSLGGGGAPPAIYVLIHGWAPGYSGVVRRANGNVLWWGQNASRGGLWTSDWAWSSFAAPSLEVNPTGLLQSVVAFDPHAIVLAYSWLDDSATDPGPVATFEQSYRSEAHTHTNGMRLADALESAIAPSFWANGRLRLIGHSHGSKVATVAALTLQQHGKRASQVTILDSPESFSSLHANGANLLGFYLEKTKVADPSSEHPAGTFVDNYASCFGVYYAGGSKLSDVVEVALDPGEIDLNVEDSHVYAAAWYGAAAAGAASQDEPPLGFRWPPLPKPYCPVPNQALTQDWPRGRTQYSQWNLEPGTPACTTTYGSTALGVTTVAKRGKVSGDPSTTLHLGANGSDYSAYEGYYSNFPDGNGHGIAFDLVWTSPQPGAYFVVTDEDLDGHQEVLFVMDGQSLPADSTTSVAINCDATSFFYSIRFHLYFLAAEGSVALSNFRLVTVGLSAGCYSPLRLAREEAARAAVGVRTM